MVCFKHLRIVSALGLAAGFPASIAFADVWSFETPSENVQCTVGQDFNVQSDITCTIIERSGPPALPRPGNCTAGWGHVFSMRERGPVTMECQHPSQDRSAFDRADYGVTGEFGGFTCLSTRQGLTCTNRDGNGFFLSRRQQAVIGASKSQAGLNPSLIDPLPGQRPPSSPSQPPPQVPQTVPFDPNARWWSDFRQGIREAGVKSGPVNELTISCDIGSPVNPGSSISIFVDDAKAPAGSVGEMTFDRGRPIAITFNEENAITVENSNASIGTFNYLIGSLKRHGSVLVRMPDGAQVRFSLRGSSRAIGHCPATPTHRQLPVAGTTPDTPATPSDPPPAGTAVHEFPDYPPDSWLKTAAAYPDFNGRDRDFRSYRTRIKNAVSNGMNFSGHYSFVTIGCGTECRFGFVVDLRTGEVFDFPYGGEEHYQMDLRFSPSSRLLKVRWKGSWESETCTEKDMLVEGTKWRILAERTVPTNDGLCFFGIDEPAGQPASSASTENTPPKPAEVTQIVTPPAPQLTAKAEGYDEERQKRWQVREQYLKDLGFDPGPVDGIRDQATDTAINTFQKAFGLEVQNSLPHKQFLVLEALAKAKGPQSANDNKPSSTPGSSTEATTKTPTLVANQTASTRQGETIRTEENGVVYHKIDRCGYERGFVVVHYRFNKPIGRKPVLEFSDICFDRKSGLLQSSEPNVTLVKTKSADFNDTYEYLSTDSNTGKTVKIWTTTVGNYTDGVPESDKRNFGSFGHHRLSGKYLNWKPTGTRHPGEFLMHGYLFKSQPAPEKLSSKFDIYIGGNDYLSYSRSGREKIFDRETPIMLGFEGSLTIHNGSGTANLTNKTGSGKNGHGSIEISINENGEVSGTGVLKYSNGRLAGMNSYDWKTAEWKIQRIVGYTVGKDGAQFVAKGIVTGQTIDQDGHINPVLAAIDITGTRPGYYETNQ